MAVTNLKAFNKALTKFSKAIVPAQLVLFQRKIALDVLKGVVLKTPVLTGRARGGWQVGVNSAPEGEPSKGANPITEGASAMAMVPPYAVIWVTNNVSYIIFLEHGSSDQAPQGMISGTLADMMEVFQT